MRGLWVALDLLHAASALLLWPLRWTAWGSRRARFEGTRQAKPFTTADWAFEVSSEGEYEQVGPWIKELLAAGQKLEVIFASESVEKGLLALAAKFPQTVHLIRLPLLTHTFGCIQGQLTATKFVLCRYDFFPSLMRQAAREDVVSGVVWATFKNRRERLDYALWRAWYRCFFSAFDWIIPATRVDEDLFRRVHGNVLSMVDFRVEQIKLRLEQRRETLGRLFPHWDKFEVVLQHYPRERRLLLGSIWQSDLSVLQHPELKAQITKGELLLLVVPHKLGPDWAAALRALDFVVHEVSESTPFPQDPRAGLWLLNLKGVLCELYGEVGRAYVGGGFERSIHSVLEPFVAGAQVWCGPKTHRSTELELIQSVDPLRVHTLPDHGSLAASLLAANEVIAHDAQGPDPRVTWAQNQIARAHQTTRELKDH